MRARAAAVALATGVAGSIAVIVFAAMTSVQAALAVWLAAALLVISLPSGALALLLAWQLHRGAWGHALARPLACACATMPAAAAIMLPVLAGASMLYPWGTDSAAEPHRWLHASGVAVRGVAYLACWVALAALTVPRGGGTRDAPAWLAPTGLVVYAVTVSLAAFDWVLAVQHEVVMSIIGMVLISAQISAALAFAIALALSVRGAPGAASLGGLGNLLLGVVMTWGYLAFMQYLVTWSGDLPNRIAFYVERASGGWSDVAVAVALLHGALPVLLLLFRRVRNSRKALFTIAVLLLAARIADTLWLVLPPFDLAPARAAAGAVAALLGAGGLWLAAFLWLWRRSPRPVRPARQAGAAEVSHG